MAVGALIRLTSKLFIKEANKASNIGLTKPQLAEKLSTKYQTTLGRPVTARTLQPLFQRHSDEVKSFLNASPSRKYTIPELKKQLQDRKPLTYTNKKLSEMKDDQIQRAAGS